MQLQELKELLKVLNENNVVIYEVNGVKLQLIPSGSKLAPQDQSPVIDDDLLFYSSGE